MPSLHWNRRWAFDLKRFVQTDGSGYYGLSWGDPSLRGIRYWWTKLRAGKRLPGRLSDVVRDHIAPHVTPDAVVLEIGSGGGRWTQYLLGAREVIAVELNPEFFTYLAERFPEAGSRLRFYRTSGYELDGVSDQTVDFVFSFGTFVHIELEGIGAYLRSVARVLRPGGVAVIHYGDTTKPFFRSAPSELVGGFTPMDAPTMEALATGTGLAVRAHEKKLLNHSNLITLVNPSRDPEP